MTVCEIYKNKEKLKIQANFDILKSMSERDNMGLLPPEMGVKLLTTMKRLKHTHCLVDANFNYLMSRGPGKHYLYQKLKEIETELEREGRYYVTALEVGAAKFDHFDGGKFKIIHEYGMKDLYYPREYKMVSTDVCEDADFYIKFTTDTEFPTVVKDAVKPDRSFPFNDYESQPNRLRFFYPNIFFSSKQSRKEKRYHPLKAYRLYFNNETEVFKVERVYGGELYPDCAENMNSLKDWNPRLSWEEINGRLLKRPELCDLLPNNIWKMEPRDHYAPPKPFLEGLTEFIFGT